MEEGRVWCFPFEFKAVWNPLIGSYGAIFDKNRVRSLFRTKWHGGRLANGVGIDRVIETNRKKAQPSLAATRGK